MPIQQHSSTNAGVIRLWKAFKFCEAVNATATIESIPSVI